MSKGSVKILIIVLVIILICTGIVMRFYNNKSHAYTEAYSDPVRVEISNVVQFPYTYITYSEVIQGPSTSDFKVTNEFYCLDKGWPYSPGSYINVGGGDLGAVVAYAIGYEKFERGAGKTDPYNDAVANIVWKEMGTKHGIYSNEEFTSPEYVEIMNAANIIQNLTNESISINAPEQYIYDNEQGEKEIYIYENENGEYGPFQIDYPYVVIQEDVIGTFTIIVNGEVTLGIDDLIKRQDGYYIRANQGIKAGEENIIEIIYEVNQYSGTYDKYVLEKEIGWNFKCLECEQTGTIYTRGYYNQGWALNEYYIWEGYVQHKEDCTDPDNIKFDNEWATTDGTDYQDIIKPKINAETKKISDSINFIAGKPELNLSIDKVDNNKENRKKLDGAGFQIVGTKQEEIKGTQDGGASIKAQKGEDEITIILTETKEPNGYVRIEEPIEITYVWDYTQKKWVNKTKNFEITTGEDIIIDEKDTNKYTIQVENRKLITISGQVWLDGQTGLKPVSPPNGKKDNSEDGISGVQVNLVDSNNKKIKTTATDSNGDYKFTNIPETPKGIKYHIEFVYDGINYIASTGSDSDAAELGREAFNNKFSTITSEFGKYIAISSDGIKTELEEDLMGKEGDIVNSKYAIKAKTKEATYNKNTTGIDLGLVKKGVDLAAVTEITSATVKINGKTRKYTYNDIQALEKDENGNLKLENLENENISYNLYLYNSDYNYRIGDYKLPAARNNALTINNDNLINHSQKQQLLSDKREADGELSVEVEYQIQLNNQSATNATINEIAYYYDINYEIGLEEGVTPELVNINGKLYNKVIMPINQVLTDQLTASFTFTVKEVNVDAGEIKNWVEIVSYSTADGCIDCDSVPNNITEHIQEDDTDDAGGLKIELKADERQVSGYIFEDKKSENPGTYNTGDGKYIENDGDKKVDDVIVQLIEIKEITVGSTILKLEYIWQETASGSGKVRYVTNDGTTEGEYTVEAINAGEYVFNQHIIPGNYIVRFIYGDGTYWDTLENTENIIKYNGQDYKSTIDIGYDKNAFDGVYVANSSMARDNEARRLEQMAYATGITAENVEKLKINTQEELNETWMCAETSPISMNISEDSTNSIVKNVNFGLVKRPRTLLQLEKHITGLKIDGITEATTELEKYDSALVNGLVVDLSYNSGESISATATSKEKNSRGTWLLQTDTDKIASKRLEITYTYRIKNIGDIDYIGSKLRTEFSRAENKEKPISEIYDNLAKLVKDESSKVGYKPGAYLGLAYYIGTAAQDDEVVSTPVQIEDYYSSRGNGLKFDTTSGRFTVLEEIETKSVWDYDNTKRAHNTGTEDVRVIQSSDSYSIKDKLEFTLKSYIDEIDSISSANDLTYRSYAAQLIYPTSGTITSEAGTLCDSGITLGNLGNKKINGTYHGGVKTYVDVLDKSIGGVETLEIVPELDEAIAETVVITLDTGADKQTPMILITTVTAGLAVIAVGIVLVKKFI